MIIFRGLLFKPLHNIEEMSILLCQALHIKLTKRLLCKELEEHPDFPSLGGSVLKTSCKPILLSA